MYVTYLSGSPVYSGVTTHHGSSHEHSAGLGGHSANQGMYLTVFFNVSVSGPIFTEGISDFCSQYLFDLSVLKLSLLTYEIIL